MTSGTSFGPGVSRRAFLGGSVAAAAAMALAACAPAGGAGTGSGTIKFWNMQWNGTPFIKQANGIVKSYKPAAGNLAASYQSISWTNWLQTFTTAAASKTTPAVSDGAAYLPFLFQEQGLTIPADNVVKELAKDTATAFVPGVLEPFKTKDGYAAIPWSEDLRVLWYNKALLEKANADIPTDWDSYIAAGVALKKIGVTGLAMAAAANGTVAHPLFCVLNNNGGGLFDEGGTPDCVTDRNIEAIEFFLECQAKGIIDPHSLSMNYTNVDAAWGQGTIGMGWDQVSLQRRLTAGAQNSIGKDLVVASPLTGPHGDKGTAFWINPLWMFKTTPSQESSEAFLTYYMKQIHALWETGVEVDVPVLKSVLEQPAFKSDANFMRAIDEWQPIAKTIAAKSSTPFGGLTAVDGGTATATLIQQICQGGMSAKAMLTACQAGLEKELNQK